MEPDDLDLWPLFHDGLRLPRARRDGRPARSGRDTRGAGGRVGSLSRQEIVAAAVKVADAEGAEAVSMRRIARELNAGAMSLYWHVSSKEDLLDLMLDAVEGEQEYPDLTGDWRADVQAVAVDMRAVLTRHEWVMDFIGGRPPLGPNTLRNLEHLLTIVGQLDIDTEVAINVLGTVATYVMGSVLREFREKNVERRDKQWLSEVGVQARDEFAAGQLAKLKQTGRFPNFIKLYEAGIDPDSAATRDDRFMFGLRCVLDGIADQLARG